MSNSYYVGQKVTMIRDSGYWTNIDGVAFPVFGVVYTISDMHFHAVAGLFLQFKEINNSEPGLEAFFEARIFRPVVERPNDAEAFIKALNIDGISKKVLA